MPLIPISSMYWPTVGPPTELETPRIWISSTPGPYSKADRSGIEYCRSSRFVALRAWISSLPMAETDKGTSCNRWLYFCAVTTISSNAVSALASCTVCC